MKYLKVIRKMQIDPATSNDDNRSISKTAKKLVYYREGNAYFIELEEVQTVGEYQKYSSRV